MKNSVRKILILIVVFLLFLLLAYSGVSVFKSNEDIKNNNKNKVEKKVYEVKELVNLSDPHCDNGYCISEYSITQMEDGKFELKFKFVNNNDVAVKESCFKLYFSEEDHYIACYDLVNAGAEVYNSYILDEDNYSKYDDYSVKVLVGDELNKFYNNFEDDLVIVRD